MESAETAKNKKEDLEPGHIIDTLMREHDVILGFLEELEKINQGIQKNKKDFSKLDKIAQKLIEAELHYRREEEVLFPELEKRGIFGPPEIMRQEHKELREDKKKIKELAEKGIKMKFEVFKEKLNESCDFLLETLREHISKENNILYPMALEAIKEKEVWQKMKTDCDKIGYCCFTPKIKGRSAK